MQYQVRTNEVFCSPCAEELAKVLELQAIGEVFVEPIRTMREWVFCGRCGTKVYSEKRTA
jgi:uncharacterized protein with PIN domain